MSVEARSTIAAATAMTIAAGFIRVPSLFVNRFFTTRIVGLRPSESDAILEMLYRHVETPELSARFKWQPNSIAFWDNRCTQHHALWDYYPHKRYGHRVTICGDKAH